MVSLARFLKTDKRFEKMISSSAKYISYTVLNGSYISIVKFSSSSVVLEPLTLVAGDAERKILRDALPKSSGGGTGIGSGLLKAVEVNMLHPDAPKYIICVSRYFDFLIDKSGFVVKNPKN